MAGIMQGLQAEAYDRQYSDQELVKRILLYFKPYKKESILIVLAIVVVALASASVPILVAVGVNLIATDSENGQIAPLLVTAVFIAGVTIWLFNWVRRRLATQVVADVVLNMREDAFSGTIHQDMSFFDEFSSGRVVSRISSDTQEFGEVIIIASDLINQLAVALILIITLFVINWQLTLLVLAMAPFVFATALTFRGLARRTTRQSTRAVGEVNKAIQEAVTGIRIAKNFRQEQAIYEDFHTVNHQAYSINIRRGFVIANIFPALNILSGIGTAVLIYFGGLSASAGIITIAAWYLFVATVDRFWFPVTNLSAFWSQFQQGLSASERVFALMDVDSEVVQTDKQELPSLHGKIEFEHLHFQYSAQEKVLDDFSLTIAPGESVALVGHTGAGKSSLVKLVSRFYEFQNGRLTIDDQDIRTLNLPKYRAQLGIVSQVPFLFAGTVAENIRYGRPQATDEEIESYAHKIGNGEWLETLPHGLLSNVGERGNRLSMGQRQLVALTRVLVQNPRIFILDEATASVDPFTEAQIQEALNLIMAERTSIIIAHRLSTIRAADRIIVLQKGKIIEQGSHPDLMAQKGHYAELYDTYFRHQSPKYQPQTGDYGRT